MHEYTQKMKKKNLSTNYKIIPHPYKNIKIIHLTLHFLPDISGVQFQYFIQYFTTENAVNNDFNTE